MTCLLAAALVAALAVPAHAAEAPSPQAQLADAAFLASAPPPPQPVKVCVVDTGVDLTTDAAPAVVERYDVGGGPVDDLGTAGLAKHGTYVAGVIASALDGEGSVGIWPHARIVSVRVFTAEGTNTNRYLAALSACQDAGTQVVNLSLGSLDDATGEQLEQLRNRIEDFRTNRDINVVAAAGNTGGAVTYPARLPAAVSVGGADAAGGLCSFSSRGLGLDLAAPGCPVALSLAGGVGLGHGTSFAAPIVSGVLAALRAYRPDLSAADAEELLLATTRTIAAGRHLNAGDAFRAAGLGALSEQGAPTAPSASTPQEGTGGGAGGGPRAPAAVAPSVDDPLPKLGVRRPRLLNVTYRRRVLRVKVGGVPEFARALFEVDGRTYRRAQGELNLRLRRLPRAVRVRCEVPGVGRSPALRVRLPAAGGARNAPR